MGLLLVRKGIYFVYLFGVTGIGDQITIALLDTLGLKNLVRVA